MFVKYAIASQLMVVLFLFFGERYSRFIFLFSLLFERCSAVAVDVSNALVATVGDSIGTSFEMNS